MPSAIEPTQTITAQELAKLANDGNRYELVQGRLRRMSPSGGEHGRIAMRLALELGNHVRANRLGEVFAAETGFLIATDPDTVWAPDVAFVSQSRLDALPSLQGYLPLAPDMLAEVVSPRDTYSEVKEKALAWVAAGVRLVLVVDSQTRTMQAYFAKDRIDELSLADTLDARDIVSGWTLAVASVFGQ